MNTQDETSQTEVESVDQVEPNDLYSLEQSEQVLHEPQDQFLSFCLADEVYGLDILRVQEIRGWEKPSSLPNMPSYVKGVINMRGLVVPIIDLRERFHVGEAQYDESTVVIITRVSDAVAKQSADNKVIGLVVDSVSDVYDIDLASLQQVPDFNHNAIDQAFIRGLATLDQQMIIILDVDRLIQQGLFHDASVNSTRDTASLKKTA